MKKNKGFTLIELLAVIIILAVIALIVTPIVLNVVNKAKVNAAKESANGIVDAARLYYQSSILDNVTYDGTTNIYNDVIKTINGQKPENDNAKVLINENGEIAVALVYNGLCFVKNFNTTLENGIKTDNCNVSGTTPVIGDYSVVNFYDWDNTLIGSTIVPKGDVRSYVNEYVLTNFIHPDLQTNKNYSSLERVDSYRGEYPSIGPNDGQTFDNGDKYPLTNGLDYVFYGKDKDSEYPYVSGWTSVTTDTLNDTWTNVGSELPEENLKTYDFSNVDTDVIQVKATYKQGRQLSLYNLYDIKNVNYTGTTATVDKIVIDIERVAANSGVIRKNNVNLKINYKVEGNNQTIYNIIKGKTKDKFSIEFELYNNIANIQNLEVLIVSEGLLGPQVGGGLELSNFKYDSSMYFFRKQMTEYAINGSNFSFLSNRASQIDLRMTASGLIYDIMYESIVIARMKLLAQSAKENIAQDGLIDVTWYQMQYAMINKGAYVSKEEAETWCKANCTWLK